MQCATKAFGAPFAREGDPCNAISVACNEDDTAPLRCTGSKWKRVCDPSFSKPCMAAYDAKDFGCLPAGAALCEVEGAYDCDVPTQTAYRCDGKRFVKAFECPKPQICSTRLTGVSMFFACGDSRGDGHDVNYAREGHPCDSEGSAACTTDQTALLSCERGKWTVIQECGETIQRCGKRDGRLRCQ